MATPRTVQLLALLLVALVVTVAGGSLTPAGTPAQAQPASPSGCATCHTDAERLAALTPPDPPAAEAGEG